MGFILRVRNENGEFENIPAIVGPKGEPGERGPQGETGPQGAAFTYDDFTEEQLASLKGDKGDPYTLTETDKAEIVSAVKAQLITEQWTFTLTDNSVITKDVIME